MAWSGCACAGYKAKGDAELLFRKGTARGLVVKVLELQNAKEGSSGEAGTISSSRVREYLRRGEVQHIQQLLDRPYAVILPHDCVNDSRGPGDARKWEFPGDMAMNQLPGDGVYDAVVCADAGSEVLGTGQLEVSAAAGCSIVLEHLVDISAVDAEYLRVELR
jgi:FAD synthase